MNLIADLGNTNTKLSVLHNQKVIEQVLIPNTEGLNTLHIAKLLEKHQHLTNAAISSVIPFGQKLRDFFSSNFNFFIELLPETLLPIENLYQTKQTLGYDRIAAAVGANNIFRDTNILLFDIGTAITIDFINDKNQFTGGNISPGLDIRFKALHQNTKKLPLLQKKRDWAENSLLASNTNDAILYGIQNSILFEIERYIEHYEQLYSNLKVVMTGGDSFFFDKKLKKTIFAELNLVTLGLNCILNHNIP